MIVPSEECGWCSWYTWIVVDHAVENLKHIEQLATRQDSVTHDAGIAEYEKFSLFTFFSCTAGFILFRSSLFQLCRLCPGVLLSTVLNLH